MNIGIIVIASNENLYLRDFVEYYHKIGATNVILGDNSPIDGDFPQLVIGDYIDKGFVKYHNKRGCNEKNWQNDFYNEMIQLHKNDYDWLCFFDIDEYITFNNNISNLQEYLSLPQFSNVCTIKINWRCYDDNGLLYYDNRPVMERFTHPSEPIDFKNAVDNYPENTSTKILLNCKNCIDAYMHTPHICIVKPVKANMPLAVNNAGTVCNMQCGCALINYDFAQLNHYRSLTISEFLYRRCSREMKKMMNATEKPSKMDRIKLFAEDNKLTIEKKKIIEDFFNNGAGKFYNV